MSDNSYDARDTLDVGGRKLDFFRLDALQSKFDVARLPFSLKVLLENLLRTEGNGSVTAKDIEALATWDASAEASKEIAFTPARVVMQDFTGVPAVVVEADRLRTAARRPLHGPGERPADELGLRDALVLGPPGERLVQLGFEVHARLLHPT